MTYEVDESYGRVPRNIVLKESMEDSLRKALGDGKAVRQDSTFDIRDSMPGTKYDQDKPRYDLLPAYALEEVSKVLTFGATKYEPDNWRKVPNAKQRYFASSQRHEWQWKRGEKFDKDSKCHHLACAITGLMFMLELEMNPEYKEIE
jgi:hypothetical protein